MGPVPATPRQSCHGAGAPVQPLPMDTMARCLVLVANARRARCFLRLGADPDLRELASFVQTQTRRMGRPGAGGAAGGGDGVAGHDGIPSGRPPALRTSERRRFAGELAAYVLGVAKHQVCDSVVLIASGPMLGDLRTGLRGPARRLLRALVSGDLTRLQEREISARIDSALALPDRVRQTGRPGVRVVASRHHGYIHARDQGVGLSAGSLPALQASTW